MKEDIRDNPYHQYIIKTFNGEIVDWDITQVGDVTLVSYIASLNNGYYYRVGWYWHTICTNSFGSFSHNNIMDGLYGNSYQSNGQKELLNIVNYLVNRYIECPSFILPEIQIPPIVYMIYNILAEENLYIPLDQTWHKVVKFSKNDMYRCLVKCNDVIDMYPVIDSWPIPKNTPKMIYRFQVSDAIPTKGRCKICFPETLEVKKKKPTANPKIDYMYPDVKIPNFTWTNTVDTI